MIYRMRIYKVVKENVDMFNDFFNDYLLPVQLKCGARLIGRWQTDDSRIVAVWEYDDKSACERIQAKVASDPDSARAQVHRQELPQIIIEREEVFMTSTVRA